MNKTQDHSQLVELGTASVVTLGPPIGNTQEKEGYAFVGISDD